MVVSNTESLLEGVTVVSELGSRVLVSVSSAESTSVTSTSVADVSVTLVVPVMDGVLGGVWVLIPVWSPSEVISSIDVGVMVLESIDITWLVVSMSPHSVVSQVVLCVWNLPSLGVADSGAVLVGVVAGGGSTDKSNSC